VPVEQVGVLQLPIEQDVELLSETEALKVENCFSGRLAPHSGHFFATSDSVRAKCSKA